MPSARSAPLVAAALPFVGGCLLGWDPNGDDMHDSGRDETGEDLVDTGCQESGPWACLDGEQVAIFTNETRLAGLEFVFTGDAAYAADREGGAIYEIPLPAGPARKLLDAPVVSGVAAGDGRVYYSTYEQLLVDGEFVEVRQLRSYTLPSGPEAVIVEDAALREEGPYFYEGYVFFLNDSPGWARRPADGSGATSPFTQYAPELTFDSDSVYFMSDGALVKAPISDPTAGVTLTQSFPSGMTSIQIQGSAAYFCNREGLHRAEIDLPEIAEVIETGNAIACSESGHAVRSDVLYTGYQDDAGAGVASYPLSGGVDGSPLARTNYWATVLHATADRVYFAGGHESTDWQNSRLVLYSVQVGL